MKNIIFSLIMLTNQIAISQMVLNPLTPQEFLDIKLNGKTIAEIKATNGQENAMKTLFGITLSSKHSPAEEWHWSSYGDGNISIQFEDYDNKGDYNLQGFKLKSVTAEITLKGINLKIGDHINKLGGGISFNNNANGGQSILFSVSTAPGEFWDEFLVISFNQETKLITKVEYIVPT